ncbi:eCIS core domain-containing protein [Methanosarcina spelaei]|uniref:eCIS core domain-containing protein n=1 Tax=Methanosarcina spelaei TaxID=1036679 RepID=UPI001BAFE658|nr:DUF4157 domain-containing protein [Methanosarcina spelaei]
MPEHQNIKQSRGTRSFSERQIIPAKQVHASSPAAIIQRARIDPKSLTSADVLQLQRTIGNRAVGRLLSEIRNSSTVQQVPVQRQEMPEEEPLQTKKENNTGMPDNLKAGVENLSGIDMSDVKVHYNSDKPAEVGALAYTQGTEIHVAPGQERHLPHEAWHVVQQAQGRVKPTVQLKGVAVNDDEGLEHEADVMGPKVSQLFKNITHQGHFMASSQKDHFLLNRPVIQNKIIQFISPLNSLKLNVVGEYHPETEDRLKLEKIYCKEFSGSSNYWSEGEFRTRQYSVVSDFLEDKRPRADPFKDRFEHVILKAKFTNFWHYESAAPPQNFIEYIQKDVNVATAIELLTNGPYRFSKDMTIMIDNLERDTDGFELSLQEKTKFLTLKQYANALFCNVSECIKLLNAKPVRVPETVKALDLMWKSIIELETNFGDVRSDAEVCESRSDAMHRAAQDRSDEKGVWKIGDAHRRDLQNKDRSYNLVSRDQFNYDLLDWHSERMLGKRDPLTGQHSGVGDFIGEEQL